LYNVHTLFCNVTRDEIVVTKLCNFTQISTETQTLRQSNYLPNTSWCI